MDADTTSHKFSHESLLTNFTKEKCDVLLGTQMITKGHDFPCVTLSVVLSADTLLNTGDFLASERAFSQIVQVCGRAGRGCVKGRAVVQTYEPKNKVIRFAQKNDYISFYQDEIQSRKMMEYPPFASITSIMISGKDEQNTAIYAQKVEKRLKEFLDKEQGLCLAFFGVTPMGVFKAKNVYRYKIIIKTKTDDKIYDILEILYNEHITNKGSFGLDIYPDCSI